jgi:hypothetical protein
MSNEKRAMKPELEGEFLTIGDNPDLGELNGNRDPQKGAVQECVDHHVFYAGDNKWHLWGCVRGTAVGRILYHWRGEHLTSAHWEKTGELLRSDQAYGEDMCRILGQEWIQSPYVIKADGNYYMFYGGHSTEWDAYGRASEGMLNYNNQLIRSASMRGQMCLMVSHDGLDWKRHLNPEGQSRLFTGPGETRDPMVLKIGNLWYMYCAGAVVHPEKGPMPQIYVRTSVDLLHWSDYSVAHYDYSVTSKEDEQTRSVWTHECPFVVEHEGYYYLLRTENYAKRCTHVYRSDNPKDFGLGHEEAKAKYAGILPVAAPEIIKDLNGDEYITSNHDLAGGTAICRLRWR